MPKPNFAVDEKVVPVIVNGQHTEAVPVYGIDNQDVLYVRVRTEYQETADAAMDRAIRIARALNQLGLARA